jgi:MFS family permease
MLIAGRIVGGFAVGMMNMTIPIYNSEIAPPEKRGMIAGLHAQFVGFGFAAANVRISKHKQSPFCWLLELTTPVGRLWLLLCLW